MYNAVIELRAAFQGHASCATRPPMSPAFLFANAVRLATVALLLACVPAAAQTPPPEATPAPPVAREIELNLIDLPTTLSMGSHRSYFRLTHRFARDLRRGDFGNLAEDFFSLDNGAVIG